MKSNKALMFAGMGFELFAIVLGALLIGPIIDDYFNLNKIGTLILLLVCIIGWMIHFVHLIQIYMKETRETNND